MSRQIAIATSILLLVLVGLGMYALHLKRHAEDLQHHASDSRPIAPPVAGPAEGIVLMAASDTEGTLSRVNVSAPMPSDRGSRAREIVRALLDYYEAQTSAHPIPARSDVNAVYLVGDKLAIVDLNATFGDNHPSGILAEELSIASIAQTLAANVPGITQVKILIDGKERETLAGHADLRVVYDVATLSAFVNSAGTQATSGR